MNYFCDTTVVYYFLMSRVHGELIRKHSCEHKLYLTTFVRGEFIRGYLWSLLELFGIIREELDVDRAIEAFAGSMGRKPRRLQHALTSITKWLMSHDSPNRADVSLCRLGEHIVNTVRDLDDFFRYRHIDPMKCHIGRLTFRNEPYSHDQVLEFAADFRDAKDEPDCNQCGFRSEQVAYLQSMQIDLFSQVHMSKYHHVKGYQKLEGPTKRAVASPSMGPSCFFCETVGDVVISLSAPPNMPVLSGDAQSFPALTEILSKQLVLVPSAAELIQSEPSRPKKKKRKKR